MSAHLFDLDARDVALTNDDWYTPRWLFEAASLRFDLDVCAPVDPSMRTVPAETYLTKLDDGLHARWSGLIWCNPPYSSTSAWVERWAEHPEGLLLVPAIRQCRWLGVVLNSCESMTLLNIDFHRPDGRTAHGRWPLVLASRGGHADAIARVATADRYIGGGYLVRPASEERAS